MSRSLPIAMVQAESQYGMAGLNRMWAQFTDGDPTLELPVYQGRISPDRWSPAGWRH